MSNLKFQLHRPSAYLHHMWHWAGGVGNSEKGEAIPAQKQLPVARKWERVSSSPGYCESHVVCAALDFVLSFQVRHIAGIFPIDGCDYISNT